MLKSSESRGRPRELLPQVNSPSNWTTFIFPKILFQVTILWRFSESFPKPGFNLPATRSQLSDNRSPHSNPKTPQCFRLFDQQLAKRQELCFALKSQVLSVWTWASYPSGPLPSFLKILISKIPNFIVLLSGLNEVNPCNLPRISGI